MQCCRRRNGSLRPPSAHLPGIFGQSIDHSLHQFGFGLRQCILDGIIEVIGCQTIVEIKTELLQLIVMLSQLPFDKHTLRRAQGLLLTLVARLSTMSDTDTLAVVMASIRSRLLLI